MSLQIYIRLNWSIFTFAMLLFVFFFAFLQIFFENFFCYEGRNEKGSSKLWDLGKTKCFKWKFGGRNDEEGFQLMSQVTWTFDGCHKNSRPRGLRLQLEYFIMASFSALFNDIIYFYRLCFTFFVLLLSTNAVK